MKIFVSWSGKDSLRVAEKLRDWLPHVLQSVTPYVSSEDIDKGVRWSVDVATELADAHFGIICITKSNVTAPWLNFEAGALSKSLTQGHVSPFLFGVDRAQLTGPLVQFQSTVNDRSDVLRLLQTINKVSDQPLDATRLDRAFDVWWPVLEEDMAQIRDTSDGSDPGQPPIDDRSEKELLEELLVLARSQQKIIQSESRGKRDSKPTDAEVYIPGAAFRDVEQGITSALRILEDQIAAPAASQAVHQALKGFEYIIDRLEAADADKRPIRVGTSYRRFPDETDDLDT